MTVTNLSNESIILLLCPSFLNKLYMTKELTFNDLPMVVAQLRDEVVA